MQKRRINAYSKIDKAKRGTPNLIVPLCDFEEIYLKETIYQSKLFCKALVILQLLVNVG